MCSRHCPNGLTSNVQQKEALMAQFTVNPQRFDPYKNFKFRVKWDGKYVAGVSRISALKRSNHTRHTS